MAKNAVIEALAEKVGCLIEENERLVKENAVLSEKKGRLTVENRELKEKIAGLEKRIGVLELGNGLIGSSVDRKRAQARINQLMREIDRCIALMNR